MAEDTSRRKLWKEVEFSSLCWCIGWSTHQFQCTHFKLVTLPQL
nr:unnamed protein product [Callosobruchus analis]